MEDGALSRCPGSEHVISSALRAATTFNSKGVELEKGLVVVISTYMTFAPFFYASQDGRTWESYLRSCNFSIISSKVNDHGYSVISKVSFDDIKYRG